MVAWCLCLPLDRSVQQLQPLSDACSKKAVGEARNTTFHSSVVVVYAHVGCSEPVEAAGRAVTGALPHVVWQAPPLSELPRLPYMSLNACDYYQVE